MARTACLACFCLNTWVAASKGIKTPLPACAQQLAAADAHIVSTHAVTTGKKHSPLHPRTERCPSHWLAWMAPALHPLFPAARLHGCLMMQALQAAPDQMRLSAAGRSGAGGGGTAVHVMRLVQMMVVVVGTDSRADAKRWAPLVTLAMITDALCHMIFPTRSPPAWRH